MSREDMMNKISFALKDPVLQMGFEVICSKLSRLEKENAELKDKEEAEQFISEVEMTKYEELMNKSDECCLKAIEFARKCDWNMATFYKNASIGFKEKALKLNVSY